MDIGIAQSRQRARLFLQSSELPPLHTLTRRWERVWRGPNSEEGTHCGTLGIYMYVFCD